MDFYWLSIQVLGFSTITFSWWLKKLSRLKFWIKTHKGDNKKHKRYVTEDDLRYKTIANGSTISVGTSVKRLVKYLITKINTAGTKLDRNLLFYLKSYADDVVFNREFCRNNGHQVLLDQILPKSHSSTSSQGKSITDADRAIILHVLLSFLDDQGMGFYIVIQFEMKTENTYF